MVTLMRWVDEGKGDLVISDVVMPDGNGLDALPKITEMRPGLPVIVISAQNTIMTAIQAAEKEAFDYLPKPFDLPDLMKRASKALDIRRRAARPRAPADGAPQDDLPLVGRTPAMQALYRLVARVMNTDLAVLISGESGTGKSLIARAIHDFSDRRTLPFVVASPADLAAMDGPATLLARARNGTILFDEVGDLTAEAQARVVRMLDSLTDNAPRVMATTQSDLAAAMEAGDFRQDLYYRLSGITVQVPPLRERVEDIPLLAEHFLARAERDGLPPRRLSAEALDLIRAYTWPGNVRQLENTIRRFAVTGGRGGHRPHRGRGGTGQPARCRAADERWRRRQADGFGRAPPAALFRSARQRAAAAGPLHPDPARDRAAPDRDCPGCDRRKPGEMRRFAGDQPEHPAKKDHRPRYPRDSPPQIDVKPQHKSGNAAAEADAATRFGGHAARSRKG